MYGRQNHHTSSPRSANQKDGATPNARYSVTRCELRVLLHILQLRCTLALLLCRYTTGLEIRRSWRTNIFFVSNIPHQSRGSILSSNRLKGYFKRNAQAAHVAVRLLIIVDQHQRPLEYQRMLQHQWQHEHQHQH